MTYPRYYNLNMGNNILSHLTIEDGLKEIISNAYDEHKTNNITRNIKIYKNYDNKWCIRDYGSGIKPSNFKFDINENKIENNDTIGMYGYGLKDAIGILFTNGIKFKIYTEKYIYTPVLKTTPEFPDIETIHIEVIKNTILEINRGTEFVFDNLTLQNINNTKNKFVNFLNPKILYEIDNCKIFLLDSHQSIFINGVEVHNNTEFQFSYDIKSSPEIRECFNRDRKQLELRKLKPYIHRILKKINITSENLNPEFLNNLQNILKSNNSEYLGEFNQIGVLRNIISQLNNLNYVFIGTSEKLKKVIKDKIKEDNKELYILGNSVKTKFNVKYIKDLYYKNNFYLEHDDNTPNIKTSIQYAIITQNINSEEYILKIIEPIERMFQIPSKLKQRILKIEIIPIDNNDDDDNFSDNDDNDDNDNFSDSDSDNDNNSSENKLNKYGYNFDNEELKMNSIYLQENKKKDLFVILFRYIVNNIDDEHIKTLVETRETRRWFNFF